MEGFLQGIQYFVIDPTLIIYILIGMLIGLVFGSIPGLSASMAAVLILPFTFSMSPVQAIALVSSMYAAGVFGGSTTSILFNIPGTPESACTTLDGYPMRKKGKASLALGAAITSSCLGGVFGALTVMLLAPMLAEWALIFGPFEYFTLTLLGLVATASLGAKSVVKGYISSLFGVLLSTVGVSMITGIERFTFESASLMAGIHFVPVMIGAFAMSEVISYFWIRAEDTSVKEKVDSKAVFVVKEVLIAKWTVIRSAILGVVVGIMPGAGSTMASFLAYSVEERFAKKKTPLGEGEIRGVIAPETANNAAAMGTLIPLLALGLPGGAVAAIMFGIFTMHNMQPGPLFFVQNAESIYPIYITLIIANILVAPMGVLLATTLTRLIYVPKHILFSFVFVLCTIGAFAVHNNLWDVTVMVVFGFVGLFMKRYGFSVAALVLGMVLGPILEASLIRTVLAKSSILSQPIGMVFLILTILFIIIPNIRSWRESRA